METNVTTNGNKENCPHLEDEYCKLATWLHPTQQPTSTTPEMCRACNRCDKPRDVNEVVLGLAGIHHSDKGPGTSLHNLITWFIPKPANCDCANRVDVMNAWGYERCQQEFKTILGWLRESALDNNYGYSEFVIAAVLRTVLYYHRTAVSD